MTKLDFSKRVLLMFMVAWITFMSVFTAYKQTTYCAEWVAGAVATIGGAPMLTALLIGGVVVAGGIALYEFSQTDSDDYRNFYNNIKSGFNDFVADQEKQIALEQDSSLSDQEASDIGIAQARDTVNNFFSGAIDGAKSTTSNLKEKAVSYWQLYSKIINDVSDNGIVSGDIITDTTPITTRPYVFDGYTGISYSGLSSVGADLREWDNTLFIQKGTAIYSWSNGSFQTSTYNFTNIDNNYFCVPYVELQVNSDNSIYYYLNALLVNKSTGVVNSSEYTMRSFYISDGVVTAMGGLIPCINNIISKCSFNAIVYAYTSANRRTIMEDVRSRYKYYFGYSGSTSPEQVPSWKRFVNNAMTDTKIGKSISTGRKALVNNGDWIGSIFQDDSVPVKKSTLSVQDGVVSGEVGWDIPYPDVWDDVFSGGKPYADVVGGTRSIGVPDDVITGTKDGDTVVEYPDSASVQDTSDYPNDTDKPQEIPEKPQTDIFDNQGGSFYPTALDLTELFPFCIPFDIIYLIEKFDADGSQAPVITIPIVYPNAIRGAMGSDSYEVTIDFQDYVTLRNVIRIFILLLFIAGLLKITRDLIRG